MFFQMLLHDINEFPLVYLFVRDGAFLNEIARELSRVECGRD